MADQTKPQSTGADMFIACEDRLRVERILERGVGGKGVPHDPDRAGTRNRQPEKCCDSGRKMPGQPATVNLAAVAATMPLRSIF